MFEGLIIGLIIAGVGLVLAAMRHAPSMEKRPKRLRAFTTAASRNETLKAITRFAQQSGYKVDRLDEANGRLVLSDSAPVASRGFFYPIFLTEEAAGTTIVEVGIRSKLFQIGPVVSRSHERCVNGIRAPLFAGN